MFSGNAMFDVVVGLVFMYLLLSLICTVINEFIASISSLRAKNLKNGIAKLIDDENLRTAFENTGLIKSLSKQSGKNGQSYIASREFASGLLQALAGKNGAPATVEEAKALINQLPDSGVKECLQSLVVDIGDNVGDFKKRIGEWFDDAMDRASGVYKRNLQSISVAVALFLSVALNADTLIVAESLWEDATLRGQLVETATELIEESGVIDEMADISALNADLRAFPIGWDFDSPDHDTDWDESPLNIINKVLGLIITGLAITLGAPFWFDVLSKLMRVRATGKTPKTES